MSDAQNLRLSKKDWNGSYVPKHTAKLMKDGIENNSAPFLPDANGNLKTVSIINANTGFLLPAKDLIPAAITKEKNGYESNAVGTKSTMDKAGTQIKPNEKGIYYNFRIEGEEEGLFHHAAYFFAEQTSDPARFAEYAKNVTKQQQRFQNETLKIESAEDYLPKYIAACKTGAKIEVTPEVTDQFKTSMLSVCNNELARTKAEKNPDIKPVNTVLYEADVSANSIIKSLAKEKEITAQKAPAKKIERDIER